MGYDFDKTQKDENSRHIKVAAICDGCGRENYVRKSWATKKIKEDSMIYHCSECSGKRNLQNAQVNELSQDFLAMCGHIFANLWDDKSEEWLARKLETNSVNLISFARDFVHQFLEIGINDEIMNCVEYIEQGADETIIDLYDWKVQLQARAVIYLEQQPRPEGLKKK